MPLCLIAIALLALSAVSLLELLNAATARAQFAQNQAEKEWSRHSVEQQVIWRTLIESVARRSANDFQATPRQIQELRRSAGAWNNVSIDLEWGGVHGNTDVEQNRFQVRVQDARGLLDVNYANPEYLNFVARVLQVPVTGRRPAVAELLGRISRFQDVTLIGDERFRLKDITGIDRREELCVLDRWAEIPFCKRDSSIFQYATFGNGILPNINLTPNYLREAMGVDTRELTSVSARIDWERIQRIEGFYDPMLSSNAAGNRYHIWITDERFDSLSFFVLDVKSDNQGRPYIVSSRIDQDASLKLLD